MRNLSLLMLMFFVGCGEEEKAETEIWEGMNPGECSDDADNDEDGDFDCGDSDCANASNCGASFIKCCWA